MQVFETLNQPPLIDVCHRRRSAVSLFSAMTAAMAHSLVSPRSQQAGAALPKVLSANPPAAGDQVQV